MKIKLSYFLGKRGTNLRDLCNNYSIGSYERLCGFLRENRVEEPTRKETEHLWKKYKSSAPLQKTKVKKTYKPKQKK